jgi:hypothetical protein
VTQACGKRVQCFLGVKGDDRNDGGKEKPWKTVNHALKRHPESERGP